MSTPQNSVQNSKKMTEWIDHLRHDVEPFSPENAAFEDIALGSPKLVLEEQSPFDVSLPPAWEDPCSVRSMTDVGRAADVDLPGSRRETAESMMHASPQHLMPPIERCPPRNGISENKQSKSSITAVASLVEKTTDTTLQEVTLADVFMEIALDNETQPQVKNLLPLGTAIQSRRRARPNLHRTRPNLSVSIPKYGGGPVIEIIKKLPSPKYNSKGDLILLNGNPFDLPTPTDLKASEIDFTRKGYIGNTNTAKPLPSRSKRAQRMHRVTARRQVSIQNPSPMAPFPQKASTELPLSEVPIPYFPYRHLTTTCREPSCPIPEAHERGPYLYKGKLRTREGNLFGASNPPPEIWRAYDRVEYFGSKEESDHALLDAFNRLHFGYVEGSGEKGMGVIVNSPVFLSRVWNVFDEKTPVEVMGERWRKRECGGTVFGLCSWVGRLCGL